MGTAADLSRRVKALALEAGFDVAGIALPDAIPQAPERLKRFLAEGHHGTMEWLESRAEERADPRVLWDGVRSIVMLGMNYGPRHDPLELLAQTQTGLISCYAQGTDYHDLIKKRLKQVARTVVAETGCEVKVFVDTAPVMEKPLAEAAGIGWQGKHTNLVSRAKGSWLFLGAIFTSLELEADAPEADHCGSCRACLDICPTDAFPAPYRLDARRCISYLTIEHKGPIPRAFRRAMGNRIYGCDDCLAVCPWNKFAAAASENAFHARVELRHPLLRDLAGLDDAGFRTVFAGSPIKRIGRDRFIRNVATALGNQGDAEALAALRPLLGDGSELVRGAAVWATAQIMPYPEFLDLARSHEPSEADPDVREEWRLALEEGEDACRRP